MARNVDVFGFDELEKAMKRCEKNYPNQADAFLMAEGQAVNKKTKSLTPVKTKKLRNSWRLKKVKLYKSGKVRVVRVQSTAPHAHLIELGHEVVRGGQLLSCWLDELTLQAFENGKITEDEFSGGFVGFKYLDTIADPCL